MRQELAKKLQLLRSSYEFIEQRRKSKLRELELLGSGHNIRGRARFCSLYPCSVPCTSCFPSLAGFQDASNTRLRRTFRENLWSHRHPTATDGQRGGVPDLPGWAHEACLGRRLPARLR